MIFILKIAIIVLVSVVVVSLMKNNMNKITLILSDIFIRCCGGKKLFHPSIEDIENKNLKKLTNELRGHSDKETLTNILEWQEQNISYWSDRQLFIKICSLPIFIFFISSWYAISDHLMNFPDWVTLPLDFCSLTVIYLFIIICFVIYIVLKYHIKRQFVGVKMRGVFKIVLPVNESIKYKLAICPDYAKLTAALLFNCYNSKVYFFTIGSHVATAVIIENEYYILDQKLPILTKDGWLKKWNVTEANVYASKVACNSHGEIVVKFKKCKKESRSEFYGMGDNEVNTAELIDNVSKLLGINQSLHKAISDFEFTLKDYAVYYENDDIVKYSLIRAIKNKLENEFRGNVDKISKIEINQCENDKDLNLSVYM